MYREWSFDLDGATVWSRSGPARAGVLRVVPDGGLDVIWRDGVLFVAGPDTVAQVLAADGATYVGVRFAPGQGPPVLGVPACELTDTQVPLDAIWPADECRQLAERLAESHDRPAVLAAAVDRRLRAAAPDPLSRAVARRLDHGHRVDQTAEALNLSLRHLHRRSLAAFGYGPKTLARVLRFNRALALARSGLRYATVAARTGYTDQAHLARDVRGLAGVPLSQLLGPP
jgi:AraC-like DNA-binding protein